MLSTWLSAVDVVEFTAFDRRVLREREVPARARCLLILAIESSFLYPERRMKKKKTIVCVRAVISTRPPGRKTKSLLRNCKTTVEIEKGRSLPLYTG